MAPQDFVAALKRHKRFLEGQLGGVRADLSDQTLSGLRLTDLDLRRAILKRTDFSGCTLAGADFRDSELKGADFRGAMVEAGKFDSADLRSSRFSGAKVGKANFSGANLGSLQTRGRQVHSDLSSSDLDPRTPGARYRPKAVSCQPRGTPSTSCNTGSNFCDISYPLAGGATESSARVIFRRH